MQVNIVIDGEQFFIAPRRLEHLVEFLNIIRFQYESQFRRIGAIFVNGAHITHLTPAYLKPFWDQSGQLTIEIKTDAKLEGLTLKLEEVSQYVTKLVYGVNLCAEFFYAENLEEAECYWTYCLEAVDWVLRELKTLEPYLAKADWDSSGGSVDELSDQIARTIQQTFDLYHGRQFREMGQVLENDLTNHLMKCQDNLRSIMKAA